MTVMSLPAQQKANTKRTGKRITFFNDQGVAMKEASQHTEGSYYGMGTPPSEQGHNEASGVESSAAEAPHLYLNSVIFSPEKGNQNRGHYQQTMPMKWPQQDISQQPHQRPVGWSQGVTMTTWPQNFSPYLGAQTGFAKHEGLAIPQQPPSIGLAEKPQQTPNTGGDVFRDVSKANRNLEWEQQQQNFQQGHKPGLFNPQLNVTSAISNTSVLQPFQVAFGQPKQNLAAGYYQVYHGNRPLKTVNYSSQTNPQHQIQQLQQQEQQQQMQRLLFQKQNQQQQQQQQQQHLFQQQTQQQGHHQQQMLQQSQQLSQSQQIQHQSKHLNQMQQSLKLQQQIQMQQPIQPHLQKSQQHPQIQNQQKAELQKLQQNEQIVEYTSGGQHSHALSQLEQASSQSPGQSQDTQEQQAAQELATQCLLGIPQNSMQQPGPRRSRRLSKEGGGHLSDNLSLGPAEQQTRGSPNGAAESGEPAGKQAIRAAPTGVIQSTRRKRRVSQEANLETLAQKASEMESLPSQMIMEPHRPWSPSASGAGQGVGEMDGGSAKRARDESLIPLVIPVSVPVRRVDPSSPGQEPSPLSVSWPLRLDSNRPNHKPSVIVTRRRSLRNSLSESSSQNGGAEGIDVDGKASKSKRRPRPEPLIIPPPKLSTFIAPPVYSSITTYQSHLRSPVRLADNPLTMPPYTPPPILSPVREGSGLYFSTILSAAAAAASGTQGLPPPATPKSATRSLLRSNSIEITPPVLSAMNEATPVSVEPRINIGQRYQAEVPELRERLAAQLDLHKAEIVWAPLPVQESKDQQQKRVDDLMHLACSSAMCGGGTNQELAMHCLHECKGDIMGALAMLLLKNPIFPKSHPLADYHYSGSDSWTPEERRSFNNGYATYKKDFFMVQKMVNSKTVAQCVEFYYTHKKRVKIGRNGTLIYGELELPETRSTEEEVDCKSSQRFELRKEEEEDRKFEESGDKKQERSPDKVTQSLQANENAGALVLKRNQEDGKRSHPVFVASHTTSQAPTTLPKPRPESTVRKSGVATKNSTAQEGEFPCKKCGRVFYKVKSRSAHMKSHAEQEKKAAALQQREAEERAAAAAAALLAAQQNRSRGEQAAMRRASSEDSSDEDDSSDEEWN